jgi:hypothetical protein
LLKILTYHQVSPCFLNFISYFGHEPLSSAGDHFFGGFYSLKSFSEPFSNFNALGRSGCHYQLVFEFRTVFCPPWQAEEILCRRPGEREIDEPTKEDPVRIRRSNNASTGAAWRLLPSWLRPRDGDESDKTVTENDPVLWPLDRCAIYHHFDVKNGKSLWMMTASDGQGNERLSGDEANQDLGGPFQDVRDVRLSANVLSTSPIDERFRASLSVMHWLAHWSLSEYGQYITILDDELQVLVCRHPP